VQDALADGGGVASEFDPLADGLPFRRISVTVGVVMTAGSRSR
jgi:hypothetical protein